MKTEIKKLKLEESIVRRGGATAAFLELETKNIVFYKTELYEGWSFDFGIASKGGGTTMIELRVSPVDMPNIVREILRTDVRASKWFLELAAKAFELESARLTEKSLEIERLESPFNEKRRSLVKELDGLLTHYDEKFAKVEHTSENIKDMMISFLSAIKKTLNS